MDTRIIIDRAMKIMEQKLSHWATGILCEGRRVRRIKRGTRSMLVVCCSVRAQLEIETERYKCGWPLGSFYENHENEYRSEINAMRKPMNQHF